MGRVQGVHTPTLPRFSPFRDEDIDNESEKNVNNNRRLQIFIKLYSDS